MGKTLRSSGSEARGGDSGGAIELAGAIWMKAGELSLGGRGRVRLLREIGEKGSISQAARSMGMSYKAAWDAVDTMNRLADSPLVERSTGGRGGGSTHLTQHGRDLIARFARLEEIHHSFVRRLSEEGLEHTSELQRILEDLTMKTSARNQFSGVVTRLTAGAVNDEVELTIGEGCRIVAVITHESSEALGLREGARAFALIKASSVMLGVGDGGRLSARNQLPGVVQLVRPGAVNTEVVVRLDEGEDLVSIITHASAQSLGLAQGVRVFAIIKASSVILGVDG